MKSLLPSVGLTGSTRNLLSVRLALIHIAIFALIAGSAFDMLTGREHWPFSNYPMYSRLELDPAVEKLHLYGILHGQETRELPLLEEQYIQPFDKTRLTSALHRIRRQPHPEQSLREAARDVLHRYELLRQAGRHDGPPLQGIRLYQVAWTLSPYADNVDDPDSRQLLLEVRTED